MSRIFGSARQVGYVVRDIEASMERWLELGVGPWFYIEKVETDWFRYRGEESPLEVSIALANSGELQLELIQQRNDAPSAYKDFLDAGREGAQHLAYWTTEYQALYDQVLALGFRVAHEGSIGGPQGRFAYLDTEFDPGTVIEISDISGPKGKLFAHIRKLAADWDGSDPIRPV